MIACSKIWWFENHKGHVISPDRHNVIKGSRLSKEHHPS